MNLSYIFTLVELRLHKHTTDSQPPTSSLNWKFTSRWESEQKYVAFKNYIFIYISSDYTADGLSALIVWRTKINTAVTRTLPYKTAQFDAHGQHFDGGSRCTVWIPGSSPIRCSSRTGTAVTSTDPLTLCHAFYLFASNFFFIAGFRLFVASK